MLRDVLEVSVLYLDMPRGCQGGRSKQLGDRPQGFLSEMNHVRETTEKLSIVRNRNIKRFSEGLIFHVPYENGIAIKRAHSAIIVDNFKLIKFYNNNELLLFDIKNDIKEKNNLAASLPEKVTQLEVLLDNYLSKVKAPKWQPGISWKNKTLEKFNSYH